MRSSTALSHREDARHNQRRLDIVDRLQPAASAGIGAGCYDLPEALICMPARARLQISLLIAAATASGLSVSATADSQRLIVVIIPPARLRDLPPRAIQASPPKLWLSPGAIGLL